MAHEEQETTRQAGDVVPPESCNESKVSRVEDEIEANDEIEREARQESNAEEKTVEIDLTLDLNQADKSADEIPVDKQNEQVNQTVTDDVNKKPVAPIKLIISNKADKHGDGSAANGLQPHGRRKSSTKSAGGSEQVPKSGRIRHIIALLALSSIVLANMNRQAYNQALVRMIRRNTSKAPTSPGLSDDSSTTAAMNFSLTSEAPALVLDVEDGTNLSEPMSAVEDVTTTTVEVQEDTDDGFDWTGAEISLLQAAFSYGYTFFMIPGGRMSEIYGAKWVIFLSSFGSALCSVMTPLLANASFTLLVASRVFMGLCQTGISPALYALFSRWLPPDESSVYLPMIKVGVMLGFMSGSLVNGFLPWQLMFYLVGLLGFCWSALWAFFASSLPSEHKFIDQSERDYIKHCLDQRARATKASAKKANDEKEAGAKPAETATRERSNSAPWLRILKNPVVLAFTFTKFTVKLSTDTQSMQIPMYLRNVFQISDELNGILNGANFAIQAIFTGMVAYMAKEMVVREQFGFHKTGIRRIFQGINCFGMALAYLLISFNMGSLNLVCGAVILLSVTSMFGSGGEAVLPIDLTTEYAASIMAIANSAANLSGIILPPIVSFFLANQLTSSENWNHVWWFISATMTCGGLMFTCLVKAKIQGFNEGKKLKSTTKVKMNGVGQDSKSANDVKTETWTAIEMEPTSTRTSKI